MDQRGTTMMIYGIEYNKATTPLIGVVVVGMVGVGEEVVGQGGKTPLARVA